MNVYRLMTPEDRWACLRWFAVLFSVIAIFLALAWPRVAKAETLLPHPRGCPAIRFCGCGAATAVFGKPIRSLWLASNWFKFPRTAPAPGMVAVRRGHVFVLRQHVQGNVWITHDYNSGGHKSRQHQRSIAGFSIVNPYAVNVAGM